MRSKTVDRLIKATLPEVSAKVDSYVDLIMSHRPTRDISCKCNFIVKDVYWSSCEHCGKVVPTQGSTDSQSIATNSSSSVIKFYPENKQ